jgi:hypothetical protein
MYNCVVCVERSMNIQFLKFYLDLKQLFTKLNLIVQDF